MNVASQFKQPRFQSSQSHFSKIPSVGIQRSMFNRDHQYKTTFNSGYLIPIFADEMLPGDTFKTSASLFARLATPITPFMDELMLDLHYFFVPNRLLWTNWEKLNGAQNNPGDPTDFLCPIVRSGTSGTLAWAEESIADYLGWPTGITPTTPRVNWATAFHTRAYNLIYKDWYRDQNMINSPVINTGDGPDSITDYPLRRRGRRHDYFTSCLPFPQKGNAVELPLGSLAYVYGPDEFDPVNAKNWAGYNPSTGAYISSGYFDKVNAGAALDTSGFTSPQQYVGIPHEAAWDTNQPFVDLRQATAATINDLREAVTLQQFLERDMRGGTRYVEILKSHFGVVSPDFRLQRPEYIGGGTAYINTSPVPQTSESTDDSPQGNLTAMATFGANHIGFNYSATEHGVVLGIVSVRAAQTYQQGMNKMFTRRSRLDFYWPTFAHLGEQPVLASEIYYQGNDEDDIVFGYQERWADYRFKPSVVTGQFRSNFTGGSLDNWHLAIDYSDRPELNESFISENPPVSRVLALEDMSTYPQLLLDSVFRHRCFRPMPVYSVPGIDKL